MHDIMVTLCVPVRHSHRKKRFLSTSHTAQGPICCQLPFLQDLLQCNEQEICAFAIEKGHPRLSVAFSKAGMLVELMSSSEQTISGICKSIYIKLNLLE